MQKEKRVYCFIDGFNLFHAIDSLKPNHGNHLKWLDLRSLASAFVQNKKEKLLEVFYFSAYPTWLPESYKTHREYVKALESTGVQCILGHFKEKKRSCSACKIKWIAHEEKASDVNIAAYLIHHAHLNSFDKALIVTADSDLAPAIELVVNSFPKKEIQILTPPNRYNIAREMRQQITTNKIKTAHLQRNSLPIKIITQEGDTIVIPEKYKK